jgi:MoaA/NifB/PqqE/SkfB family radical SAM enzyme
MPHNHQPHRAVKEEGTQMGKVWQKQFFASSLSLVKWSLARGRATGTRSPDAKIHPMATAAERAYKRLYERVHYRLRTFSGGRYARFCRPVSIIFLLTERCNARCVHCDIWKNKGGEPGPAVEEWQRVLDDLRDWLGPVQVTLSGGEALLRPYSVDLAARASASGLFVEVLTHGYWLDQSRIRKLALANPWRITVSLDAVSDTHSRIRGRPDFFPTTMKSIETLLRLRRELALGYDLCLKTVVMEHNLDEIAEVARFATNGGMRVFYQPIEQNYNTPEDPLWFTSGANWPRDIDRAVRVVEDLIRLKRQGLPIDNSLEQLQAMALYFRNPAGLRIATQTHNAHEKRPLCSATTTLQFQANGDVKSCAYSEPIGNIRQTPIRRIWEKRPAWWERGCCMHRRAEAARPAMAALS